MKNDNTMTTRKTSVKEDDFFPTPKQETEALMKYINLYGLVREPCCGDGAISRILKKYHDNVFSSDLVDRGYGEEHRRDFLLGDNMKCDWIITNPPFKLANEFMYKSLELADNVALLLPIRMLSSLDRIPALKKITGMVIIPHKIDFISEGNPKYECSWYLWEKDKKPIFGVADWKPYPNKKKLAQIKTMKCLQEMKNEN